MLLGFKWRFVGPILAGTKAHTVRGIRKDGRRAKVGERLYLYCGLRTKQCEKIGEAICSNTADITIYSHYIEINGMILMPDEEELFAQADGFDSYEHFKRYWSRTQPLPFNGVVTYWKDIAPVILTSEQRSQGAHLDRR